MTSPDPYYQNWHPAKKFLSKAKKASNNVKLKNTYPKLNGPDTTK